MSSARWSSRAGRMPGGAGTPDCESADQGRHQGHVPLHPVDQPGAEANASTAGSRQARFARSSPDPTSQRIEDCAMPAIDPARLAQRSRSCGPEGENPARLAERALDLLDFYADRTRRTKGAARARGGRLGVGGAGPGAARLVDRGFRGRSMPKKRLGWRPPPCSGMPVTARPACWRPPS